MNRVLVKLYVPQLEKQYDVWIPVNKTVLGVLLSLIKGIDSLNKVFLEEKYIPNIYNKENSEIYNFSSKIIDTNIRNGTELIIF